MADITMPQLGETVTEGTITKWLKQVGDAVAADEPLFEVSTEKVDTEVPAPMAGYLAEIKVPEGDTVEVGVVLAVISQEASAAAPAPPAAEPAHRAGVDVGRSARCSYQSPGPHELEEGGLSAPVAIGLLHFLNIIAVKDKACSPPREQEWLLCGQRGRWLDHRRTHATSP